MAVAAKECLSIRLEPGKALVPVRNSDDRGRGGAFLNNASGVAVRNDRHYVCHGSSHVCKPSLPSFVRNDDVCKDLGVAPGHRALRISQKMR